MSHRSPRTAEQTVALVVSFSTVRFCPDEKPLPVTVIDPLETPVGGSTLTIGLDAAEEVPDIDATGQQRSDEQHWRVRSSGDSLGRYPLRSFGADLPTGAA